MNTSFLQSYYFFNSFGKICLCGRGKLQCSGGATSTDAVWIMCCIHCYLPCVHCCGRAGTACLPHRETIQKNFRGTEIVNFSLWKLVCFNWHAVMHFMPTKLRRPWQCSMQVYFEDVLVLYSSCFGSIISPFFVFEIQFLSLSIFVRFSMC